MKITSRLILNMYIEDIRLFYNEALGRAAMFACATDPAYTLLFFGPRATLSGLSSLDHCPQVVDESAQFCSYLFIRRRLILMNAHEHLNRHAYLHTD